MTKTTLGALLIAALLLVPVSGLAQEMSEAEYHRNITVRQKRPFLEGVRLEVNAGVEMSLSTGMYSHWGPGGSIDWHINEDFYVGAKYIQWFASKSSLQEEVQNSFELVSDPSEMMFQTSVRFGWVPLMGKMSVLGAFIGYFDCHTFLGGGVVRTHLSDFAPMGQIGAGARFFLHQGIAIVWEISDSIYYEDFLQGSGIVHNVSTLTGVSIFFPFTVDSRYEK